MARKPAKTTRASADRRNSPAPGPQTPVAELRSLGPASGIWLNDVGIYTHADLRRLGAVAAYRLVKAQRPKVSRNLLYALEAALRNQHWHEFLTPLVRARLTKLAEEVA